MTIKKIISEVMHDAYPDIKIFSLRPFFYKNRENPNHFILKEKRCREWFLKVSYNGSGDILFLDDLYNLLWENSFPALYPKKNIYKEFVTYKNDYAIQFFPFVKSSIFDTKNKREKEISLFASFYNIVNSCEHFIKKLNTDRFKKRKNEFEEVLNNIQNQKRLKTFFYDFDSQKKKLDIYFKKHKKLRICHGDCSDRNLLYYKKSLLLIDFDSIGFDDLCFEIFHAAYNNAKNTGSGSVADFENYMKKINRKLLPFLRFSQKDLMSQLDVFIVLNTVLRLKYCSVKNVLTPAYWLFYRDVQKHLRKNAN